MYAPITTDMRLKTTSGGSLLDTKRRNAAGGARRAEANTIGRPRNRVLVIQDSTDRREAKVFRTHVAPQGVCDNLIMRSSSRQTSRNVVTAQSRWWHRGFQENSRLKTMDGEAVKVGD